MFAAFRSLRYLPGKTPHYVCRSRSYTSVNAAAVADRVQRVLTAKTEAGLSYDELAEKLGVTNTYCAQLLLGQAKLTPGTASKLASALPSISSVDLQDMQYTMPMRTFDSEILKEPNVYRTYEAVTHYGEAIKLLINEQCGDGIMSAIDFYCDVGTTTGKHGEKRVVSFQVTVAIATVFVWVLEKNFLVSDYFFKYSSFM